MKKIARTEKLCDSLVEYEGLLDEEIYKLNGVIAAILVIKRKIDAVVDGLMDGV